MLNYWSIFLSLPLIKTTVNINSIYQLILVYTVQSCYKYILFFFAKTRSKVMVAYYISPQFFSGRDSGYRGRNTANVVYDALVWLNLKGYILFCQNAPFLKFIKFKYLCIIPCIRTVLVITQSVTCWHVA